MAGLVVLLLLLVFVFVLAFVARSSDVLDRMDDSRDADDLVVCNGTCGCDDDDVVVCARLPMELLSIPIPISTASDGA